MTSSASAPPGSPPRPRQCSWCNAPIKEDVPEEGGTCAECSRLSNGFGWARFLARLFVLLQIALGILLIGGFNVWRDRKFRPLPPGLWPRVRAKDIVDFLTGGSHVGLFVVILFLVNLTLMFCFRLKARRKLVALRNRRTAK